MTADHQDRLVGALCEKVCSRAPTLILVEVDRGRPLGMNHLARVMNEVARDHRFLAGGLDVHRDMAGRMARCRRETDLVADSVIAVHEIGQATLDDRPYRIVDHGPCVVGTVLPVLPLLATEEVARARKRGEV